MDAVDLTRSDSDEDVRLVKRQRTSSPDEEVQVVEEPDPPAPVAAGPDLTLGDKELLIIRATGPVRSAARTFVRYGCAVFKKPCGASQSSTQIRVNASPLDRIT